MWKPPGDGDELMRKCTKCGEIKAADEFLRNHRWCKACLSVANAIWRAANSEKVKAQYAAWAAANQEKRKASSAAWIAVNREKIRIQAANRRAANPEKGKAQYAAWAAANREKRRISEQNRRQRVSGNKLSPDLPERLLKLQRGKCPCCKQPLGDNYHLDHIMPIKLGGSNTDDNIQLLRAKCNHQKHATHPIEFMQSRGYLL